MAHEGVANLIHLRIAKKRLEIIIPLVKLVLNIALLSRTYALVYHLRGYPPLAILIKKKRFFIQFLR